MLILKAYINERLIDAVCIQNVGQHKISRTKYKYVIRKPLIADCLLLHKREDGWMPLAAKALTRIWGEKSK